MTSMKEKIRRFMAGRYGVDALNQFLSMASIVLLLISLISRVGLLTWVAFGMILWSNYRTFSRNISKRTEENYKFYTLKDRLSSRLRGYQKMWADRKTHRYYRCPQCHQQLRVPRGRGRIQISCPRCGTQFIKKS